MTASLIYDGSTAVTVARKTELELTEAANMGVSARSRLVLSDTTGTLALIGHKRFRAEEDDCAVVTTYRGFVGTRTINRGPSEKTGAERQIAVEVVDLNARCSFKVLRGSAWRKRPKESVGDRLTALLSSGFFNVEDHGFVQYPDTLVDKGDLRGKRPGDLLAEMAEIVGFNFFLYPDDATGDVSLWFQDSNTSTDWSSDLRISNVLADIDTHTVAGFLSGTTFYPSGDTNFTRDPERVVSSVWLPFKESNVYRTRTATEETYEPRDGVAPTSNVKRRARARNLADRYLRVHSTEEDTITTTIQVPASKVNLVRPGQRLECKFSHLATEGYGSFTWMRIMERTVKALVSEPRIYQITMTLSPQEAAAGGGDAALVQYKMVTNETDTNIILDDDVTVGHVLVAAMVKNSATDMPAMPGGAGWTLLGEAKASPGAGQAANSAQWGWCAVYAKVATDTDPDHGRETTPGTRIRWGLYEISGASLDDIQVFELERQSVHNINAVVNMGTFSGSGFAVMPVTFPRESGEAGQTIVSTFAAGWTEDFDNYLDPDAFGNPWVAIGHGSGEDLQAALTATETLPDQFIAEAGGVAVLFE